MTLFGDGPSSDEEGAAFFDRFVYDGPSRLAWFLDEVRRLTGRRPEPVAAEVEWLTTGVVQNLTTEVPGVQPPAWYEQLHVERGWTPYGAALADGLVHFVAEIYHRRLGAVWQLEADPGHAHHRRPVMSVPGVTPPWRLLSLLEPIRTGQQPPARVARAVQTVLDGATPAQAGQEGQDGDVPLLVTVAPLDHASYDHELFVDEAAESVLGRAMFDALVDRFAAIPGVDAVVQEDREIFLVSAPDLAGPILQAHARRVVEQARHG